MTSARKSTRWLWRLALVSLVIISGAVGGRWLLHRSFFSVQHVRITGAVHESRATVLRITGLAEHPAMIDVNDGTIARRLERLSWVSRAHVLRQWPSTVLITIHERVPVAVARQQGQLFLVDRFGVRVAPIASSSTYPLLVATDRATVWPFHTWAQPAAIVASQLPKAFRNQVAQVVVDPAGDVSMEMTTPITFLLGPDTDLHQKFVAVASVIAHVTLRAGDVVDVTVPDAPTVSGP